MEEEIYNYCEFCGKPLNLYSRMSTHICEACRMKIKTLLLDCDFFEYLVANYNTVCNIIEDYKRKN